MRISSDSVGLRTGGIYSKLPIVNGIKNRDGCTYPRAILTV